MGRRHSVISQAAVAHRTVNKAIGADSTPPASTHADWGSSNNYPVVRVFADVAFTGGTSPSVDLGVWIRKGTNVGRAPNPDARWTMQSKIRITGTDKVTFDVLTDGDDFLVLVEAVNGTPDAWSVALSVSRR